MLIRLLICVIVLNVSLLNFSQELKNDICLKLNNAKSISQLNKYYSQLKEKNRLIELTYLIKKYKFSPCYETEFILLKKMPKNSLEIQTTPYDYFSLITKVIINHKEFIKDYINMSLLMNDGSLGEIICETHGYLVLKYPIEYFKILNKFNNENKYQILGCLEINSWEDNKSIRQIVFNKKNKINTFFVDYFHNDLDKLLILFTRKKNYKVVKELVEEGANANKKNKIGKSALVYAIEMDDKNLIDIFTRRKPEDNVPRSHF